LTLTIPAVVVHWEAAVVLVGAHVEQGEPEIVAVKAADN
jgi:hypothetical protein